MAKKNDKISMPMSGAGLVRYFDDESVGPKSHCYYFNFRNLLFNFKILRIDKLLKKV